MSEVDRATSKKAVVDWSAIADAWAARSETRAALAKRAGVSVSALRRRAAREGWSPAAGPDVDAADTIAAARALYAELMCALRGDLARLRSAPESEEGGPPTGGRAAMGRADLIKAHARALFALIDCDEKLAKRGRDDDVKRAADPTRTDGPATLDLAAARDEFARRLARLAAEPSDQSVPESP